MSGRPLRAEAISQPLTVLLSPEEREFADAAARANHQTLSAFVRDAILSAVHDCLEIQPDSFDEP